ncbi:MAG: hypothetical protein ACO2Y2_07740 [Poseidonia sp.]
MPDEADPPLSPVIISSSPQEPPSTVEVKAAPMMEAELEKQKPESSGILFLFGLLIPLLVVFFLTNSSLFSPGAWEFNRREEVLLYTDDDGVFRFDLDPKVSHGIEESMYIIFLDPPLENSMAYRPEIHIGSYGNSAEYRAECDVQSMNSECIYTYRPVGGGEREWTKLGEYDQVNHTAEFVLNGEANESIGLRVDYHDEGAARHYYEVEQPRNQQLAFTLVPIALIGMVGYSAVTGRWSLAKGLGTSFLVIAGIVVLMVVGFILQVLNHISGG